MSVVSTGFLIDYIPLPVISGFTSAAAITIGFGQVKVNNYFIINYSPLPQSLLGITKHVRRPFLSCVYDTFKYITYWSPWDFALGSCCIILVIFLKVFQCFMFVL